MSDEASAEEAKVAASGPMVAAPGEQEAVAKGEKQPHEVEMIPLADMEAAAAEDAGDDEG